MANRVLRIAALALLASCAHGNGKAHVGSAAPQWTLATSTGGKLSMQSLAGQPVYLNLFATWCGPCNVEAPDINALQKKYAAQGLRVIGIDELESAKQAQTFVNKYSLVYPALVDDGTIEDEYSVNGLPVHIFIARDGTVRAIRAGEMSRAEIESAIRSVL